MTRWPESVRRAVMMTLDHEVPAVASMARWEPDERQRLRDHARLLAALTEFAEKYRVGCDAIGMPCQNDAASPAGRETRTTRSQSSWTTRP
jgi:hypothetical protein